MTDLTIKQGATFRVVYAWQNPDGTAIPLTGLSARMQARRNYATAETLLDLTEGSGLTLVPAAGEVHVELSAVATAALPAAQGVFDIEVFDPLDVSEVTRLDEGRLTISPEVTR